MLIEKVNPNEPIDRALKRFKRKFLITGVVKELRKRSVFKKKSEKKREEKQKAIYVEKKFKNIND